jgi:hypothetical protein
MARHLGHRLRRTWWLGGALALIFACGDALRQDELDCEEAVAHLKECCPNFPTYRVSCVYQSNGCESNGPDIDMAQSQCARDRSCSELVQAGVCERFEGNWEYLPAVCP